MSAFGDRLGPIRVQIVRRRDDEFLRRLLRSLDPGLRWALDLEHESWADAGVEGLLRDAGVALVGSLESDLPFRYVRLREPPYDEAALAGRADRIRPVIESGADVFCYFRHEDDPRGALYARRLLDLVG
jgi:uncharacterized protein YecE (DUF72 family)